jgi:hypothetical protein
MQGRCSRPRYRDGEPQLGGQREEKRNGECKTGFKKQLGRFRRLTFMRAALLFFDIGQEALLDCYGIAHRCCSHMTRGTIDCRAYKNEMG